MKLKKLEKIVAHKDSEGNLIEKPEAGERKVRFKGSEPMPELVIKPLKLNAVPKKSLLKSAKKQINNQPENNKNANTEEQTKIEPIIDEAPVITIEKVIDLGKREVVEKIKSELEGKKQSNVIGNSSQFQSFWKNLGDDPAVIDTFFQVISLKIYEKKYYFY